MKNEPAVFPFTLYNVTGRLIRDREVARMISADQQLFGAFFTMAYKLLAYNTQITKMPLDPAIGKLSKMISDVNSKSFSISELSESAKLAESLRKQLGQHVTAEYLGKFLAFCDLFFKVQTGHRDVRDAVPDAVAGIGSMMCKLATDLRQGKMDHGTVVEANIQSVGRIYELNDPEMILLEHAALLSIDQDAFIFFKLYEQACERKGLFRIRLELALTLLFREDIDGFDNMKAAMNAVDRILSHKTSKVLAFNIAKVATDGGVKQLSPFWTRVITYDQAEGADGFVGLFLKEVKTTKTYSSVIARMNEKMIPLLKDIVASCSEKATVGAELDLGVNMLLYGPRSLDKDQALHRALDGVAFNMYEANTENETWGDEASITWAAQRILEEKTNESSELNILLVREAATVLSRGSSRMSFASIFGEEKDDAPTEKVELDSDVLILTKSRTPTIWYTTDVTRLSTEAVGKFMLHLEVIPGTRADRKAEVEKIADGLNLPADVRLALSKYMQLGAVQVETAARVVKLLELEAPKSYETLLQLVEESQKALERDKIEEIRTSVTKYDLGLLNIHGKYSPEQVIEALRKKKAATLCFYGLPGTGKTQLAEYIADRLDMPLLVKRASDILSKWVGENEKHIAEMFREAKAEGAVLLLDEADSFLRDRALAKSQWEVTMVNELLQGMERHTGIFICASNLFESLDAAALRRFTFKFQFLELDEVQRIKMFNNEAGVELVHGSEMYDQLMMIRHLTPGDFATVKRQINLFDQQLTPSEWLTQLNEESKAKLAGLQRNKFIDVDRV